MQQHRHQLNESLSYGDLEDFVSDVFGVDRYTSKMGDDKDVIVLSFHVKDKLPAIDLMEFVEKGYPFILDADMSAGEEEDGKYHVFIEIPRSKRFPDQLNDLLKGIGNLCNCQSWKFQYLRDKKKIDVSTENIQQYIPLDPVSYKLKLLDYKNTDIREFFNKGGTNVKVQEDNTIVFSRPFSGDIKAKFISIGEYKNIKQTLPGALDLTETGQSQIFFLNKYLGDYVIDKIGNKFLIKNGNNAVVIEKNNW